MIWLVFAAGVVAGWVSLVATLLVWIVRADRELERAVGKYLP